MILWFWFVVDLFFGGFLVFVEVICFVIPFFGFLVIVFVIFWGFFYLNYVASIKRNLLLLF